MRRLIFTIACAAAFSLSGSWTMPAVGATAQATTSRTAPQHRTRPAAAPIETSRRRGAVVGRAVPRRRSEARVNRYVYTRPYYFGNRFVLGWPYSPFWYGAPWPYTYPVPYAYDEVTGGLRLEVEPTSAQVFVDGYYAGIVDDFDGHFQHLNLVPGGHRVELRAPGYQTRELDIYIQPDHTTEWQGAMIPSKG
jgi:hypothetical protein